MERLPLELTGTTQLRFEDVPLAHEAVKAAYDQLAQQYDTSFLRPIDLAENAVAHALVRRAVGDTGRLLDLGCGTGLLLEELPISPDAYVGIDLSPSMLAVARSKFPHHTFLAGDMVALPFKEPSTGQWSWSGRFCPDPGRFERIVSLFGSPSYVLQPELLVSTLFAHLRPGGRFCLMFLGFPYEHRRTHIVNANSLAVPFMVYNAQQLRQLFSSFAQVQVQGLNLGVGDRLPLWLGRRLTTAYLRVETAYGGRRLVNRCFYLVVSGMRP